MVVVVLAAMLAQATTLAEAHAFDASRFFAYFTIQSNLIGVGGIPVAMVSRGIPSVAEASTFCVAPPSCT